MKTATIGQRVATELLAAMLAGATSRAATHQVAKDFITEARLAGWTEAEQSAVAGFVYQTGQLVVATVLAEESTAAEAAGMVAGALT